MLKISILTFLKWLFQSLKVGKLENCKCSGGTKLMQKTLNVLWNDG